MKIVIFIPTASARVIIEAEQERIPYVTGWQAEPVMRSVGSAPRFHRAEVLSFEEATKFH